MPSHGAKLGDLVVGQVLGTAQERLLAETDAQLRGLLKADSPHSRNAHPGMAGLVFLRAIQALNVVPPSAIMTELTIEQITPIPLDRDLTTEVRVSQKFIRKGRNLVTFGYKTFDGEDVVLEMMQTIIWPSAPES
jgi:hypothetical protein